jgi:hypothetical protein
LKARATHTGRQQIINGRDQAETPEVVPFLFPALTIPDEDGATDSLVALIGAMRVLLQTEPTIFGNQIDAEC